uniref:SH2 domain-containing protein n=1 Tax=Arion vulgaris TaxID=1028688 RepID=A0A0B6ZSA7_9EUPU
MTSTLSNVFRSQKSNISAQDLIKLQNSVFKIGMLRKKGLKINFGKWPHRFVVLTHDSIYVYANEVSKITNSQFSLLGYNRVSRCDIKGQDLCFSIKPASSIGSVKVKTFACSSEGERKAWMQAIRSQIYVANNIVKPTMTVIDRIKAMTINDCDEDFYLTIEKAVYETTDSTSVEKNGGNDDDDDEDSDDSCESDHEVHAPVSKKAIRSLSLPHNSIFTFDDKNARKYSKDRKLSESCESNSTKNETVKELFHSMKTFQDNKRRYPSDPQPKIPVEVTISRPGEAVRETSDYIQSQPPRYSEVYEEEVEENFENDYVNLSNMKKYHDNCQKDSLTVPSLEEMCTISDTFCNREQCITLLQEKEYGTYLLRNSRTDNQKVIVYLGQNGEVKEYKIYGTADNPTIDRKKYFTCLNKLLQHYTSEEPLPGRNDFLKKGCKQKGK